MKAKSPAPDSSEPEKTWQKTSYANLIRYVPSGTYYARIRVKGKLIRKRLKTDVLSVAKLRLADFEKQERQRAETADTVAQGKMTVGDAVKIHLDRISGDASLKPRTREYHDQRVAALFKSWPELKSKLVRDVTKTECLNWAAKFGRKSSPSAFNHTISTLRALLEIGCEAGARYDNPARFIKRASERPKHLVLPTPEQFDAFVTEMENGGGGFSKSCAELVRFMAFGGFRKSEAANVVWSDVDMEKGEILVRGDAVTGTKNWSVRRVPMIAEMRQLLERLKSERRKVRSGDAVMRVRECQKAMDRAAKAVSMARITHHDLRHLFATRCIESGVDVPTVSRWLGHKDGGALAMKTYGHLRDHHSTAMAQKVTFGRHESLAVS